MVAGREIVGRGLASWYPATVPGTACQCVKMWIGCKGDVVGCKDPASDKCLNPDRSELSCLQGGGDCGGY